MDCICRLCLPINSFAVQLRQISLCIPLFKTHYETLGLTNNATLRDIKEAYYRKSKIVHPDQNEGNTREFLKLKTAYDTLRRPADRKQYDMFLAGIHINRSHNYHGQHWNNYWNRNFDKPFWDSARARQEQETRSWRNVFLFTLAGCILIAMYDVNYWYRNIKLERNINALIQKDEIAKCFLRQKEFSDCRDDNVQIDHFARLLRADIEEKQRLRDEERALSSVHNPLEIRESQRWMNYAQSPDLSRRHRQRSE